MILTLAVLAVLAAGYVIGRYRPAHRVSDWAHWQRYGTPPTGARYWAVWAVLSAESIGWLITHPMTQQPKARPARVTLYLSTPCAVTTCRHPYNWHTASGCTAATEANRCSCIAFAIPATEGDQTA